jgi:hypothetical protein
MMIDMNPNRNITARSGIAMLAVLMIVMVIAVVALGFLSRSDVELACGQNMALRTQMDHLAESGLEHARGLVLNPQDVAGEYWTGQSLQQLVAGSADYYDLVVTRDTDPNGTDPTYRCNYTIDCNSYRLSGSERIGRSNLRATLRLDPVIAYWAGSNTTVSEEVTINGDVYCNGNLVNNGIIEGDAFSSGTIGGSGTIRGQSTVVAQEPVAWPNLLVGDFGPTYLLGASSYAAATVDANEHPGGTFGPSEANPAGIRYRNGDLELPGGVNIAGTLVVTGELRISGANNSITAQKNYPALLVGAGVVVEGNASVVINGLAQIDQAVVIDANSAEVVDVDVTGGLFVANGGIDGISSSTTIDIIAAPAIASIQIWPAIGPGSRRWGPAGGAFFRSIERR